MRDAPILDVSIIRLTTIPQQFLTLSDAARALLRQKTRDLYLSAKEKGGRFLVQTRHFLKKLHEKSSVESDTKLLSEIEETLRYQNELCIEPTECDGGENVID